MSGANVRKRTREEEELAQSRPQIQRRSKIEIGYIVAQFRRKVIANNGLCTGCGKQLMSLNELAEYEFDFTQETVVKHADQKCVHPRVVSLDEDIVMSTGICVSDESEDDSREENEEDGDEDEDEDEGQPGESSEHCDSWECHLLLNADPIQAKGSRQTGLMVRNHLGDQVRPGGQTLAEILHFILSEDRPVHVIEDMLRVARTSSGNEFMPNSFHVLKQALHMRSLAAVDVHICGGCWQYAWKPVEKEKWPKCDDDCSCDFCTCPICHRHGIISKRFKRDLSGGLEPQQNCYYFGLEHQINAMYSNDEFRRSRKRGKTFDKVGSWWSSEHVRWINAQTGGLATPENDMPIQDGLGEAFMDENGVYSLHFDWVQVCRMGKKSNSVGMIVLRCEDVEESKLNKDEWSMPLMVIPGPKEPPSMDIHWQIIKSQFHAYSTGAKDLTIKYRDEEGTHEYTHRPFLVRACCDAVARHKLLHCRNAAAKLVCPWCWTTSSDDKKSKIFGYAAPISSPIYDWADLLKNGKNSTPTGAIQIQLGVTEPHTYKVTMDQHRQRSNLVHHLNSNPDKYHKSHVQEVCKRIGISGKCHISWELKTLHPLEFVHLPLYHILFLGIVKDFLKHVFREDTTGVEIHEAIIPNSGGVKQFDRDRTRILLNCDMTDMCIDLHNIGGWLISSLVGFVEVHSCFMFNERVMGTPVLSKVGTQAWGHLRRAVMYFLRDSEETMSLSDWKHGRGKEARNNARGHLVEYAKICEEYMPALCVSNLHISICRLFDQEEYSGRPNICHDLFTERVVRHLKKISYRKNHEKSFVYRQLYREGRLELARKYGIKQGESAHAPQLEKYDISDELTCLLGAGEECHPFDGVYQQTQSLYTSLLDDQNIDINSTHPWGPQHRVFSHAELYLKHPDRFETIKSLRCLKEVRKNSKVVLIRFERKERLALVTTFSRVARGHKTLARYVHCHLFKYLKPDDDQNTGTVYRYRHSGPLSTSPVWVGEHCDEDFEEMDVTLPVECIIGKVVQFISPVLYSEDGNRNTYHMVYCARSRSRSGQSRPGAMSWLESPGGSNTAQ